MGKSDDIKWIEPIALVCADSFLKTAQSFIDIKRIHQELPEGPVGTYGPAFGDLAVCATNLAFALEIYLKCLRAQLGLPQARGHDLWELYSDLPSRIKSAIETRYERGRTNPSPAYASISFALTRRPDKLIWQDLGLASMKLEDVLKRSKDVFVSWRYIFEFRNAEDENSHEVHRFEYLLLLLGCVAINEAILRNWYTPRLGDPNVPRPWMVLSESDFAKVSSSNLRENATITDQYTGKQYRVRNVDGDQIVEELN